MSKPYEDIGKEGSDFLFKGFPNSGFFKITAETKTPNGLTVTSTGSRSLEIKDGTTEEKLSGSVEPKFELKSHNIELTGKLSTLGEFEGGFSVKDLVTKGTKFSLTALHSDKDGAAVKSSVAFKNDLVSTKAGVKYPFKSKTYVNWNGEVVFRYPEFLFWGVDIRFDSAVRGTSDTHESEQPKNQIFWNARTGYVSDKNHVTVGFENVANKDKKTSKHNPALSTVSVNLFRVVNESFKIAFGVNHEIKQVKGTEINVGGEYKLDKHTSLKGKLAIVEAKDSGDREVRLGLAAKQSLTENSVVTLGADINTRALWPQQVGSTKPTSLGFEIKLTQ